MFWGELNEDIRTFKENQKRSWGKMIIKAISGEQSSSKGKLSSGKFTDKAKQAELSGSWPGIQGLASGVYPSTKV